MKKPSFFERLAGNLRFDDDDTDIKSSEDLKRPERPVQQPERREVPVNKPAPVVTQETVPQPPTEEVGELPVDVYQTPSEIIIQTLIAGVLPENLSINITRDVVSISGKREESKGVPNNAYAIRELY